MFRVNNTFVDEAYPHFREVPDTLAPISMPTPTVTSTERTFQRTQTSSKEDKY